MVDFFTGLSVIMEFFGQKQRYTIKMPLTRLVQICRFFTSQDVN